MCEAGSREDRGDEQGGFVTDSAGGVLVDGEGVERFGVGDLSGEAHGLGECGEFSGLEAAEEDGHQEGGDLAVGDELPSRGALDDGEDEGADFGVGEGEAVTFVQNDIDGMDGHASCQWLVLSCQLEGGGEERSDSDLGDRAFFAGEKDDGFGGAELVDGLAAGSAGLAGGVVEGGDGDGADADLRAMETDGCGDGGLFGADGETVGGVFDVAADDDSTVRKQDSGADTEAAVRSVGVVSDGDGALLQVRSLRGRERTLIAGRGWVLVGILGVVRRHRMSEATGCGG